MQTRVPASADQGKQQQTKTVRQPAQLASEQQHTFVASRLKGEQAAEGGALQTMMSSSQRQHQLHTLQAMMNNSPRQRQLQALQAGIAAGVAQRAEEEEPRQAKRTGVTIQRAIDHDAPVTTLDSGRAGRVRVENIRGKPYGESHNQPSVDPFGWPQLHHAGHTLANPQPNNSHYNAVRMHLWNGRLGGPGNQVGNLAPGPAKINSSMSAGPEMAAKDAVTSGYRVWTDTVVTYRQSGNNPNDFNNVVPGHMEMQWGYMVKANGNPAENFTFAPVTGAGPAEAPAWSVDIDQPAGALLDSRKLEYQGLADGQTADLNLMFAAASIQEKAQAFGLVTMALKAHIIGNYPEVYHAIGTAMQAQVLNAYDANGILALLPGLGITNIAGMMDGVLEPLFSIAAGAKATAVLALLAPGLRNGLITKYKWDLLGPLGDDALPILKSDWKYLGMAPALTQIAIFNACTVGERNVILTSMKSSKSIKIFLDRWAKANGAGKVAQRFDYLDGKIGGSHLITYREKLKHEINNEKNPGMGARARRTQKIVVKLDQSIPIKRISRIKKGTSRVKKGTSRVRKGVGK